MYGYVYLTTNLVNGKMYIGQHKWNKRKYLGSGKILKQAIEKYGEENFSLRILQWCKNKWDLDCREKAWILMYDAVKDPNFYNITDGGTGGDTCVNLSEEDKKVYKQHFYEGMYKNIDKNPNHPWRKGRIFTESHKKNIGEASKGRKHTEEWKEQASLRNKGKWIGENGPSHILTNEQVLEIVEIYKNNPKLTYNEIGKKYNVSASCVQGIMNGLHWSSITGIKKEDFIKDKEYNKLRKYGLTKELIFKMIELKNKGMICKEISNKLNVSNTTVYNILHGISFSEITGIQSIPNKKGI